MAKMTTCLWFDRGEARNAAEFYASVFPDTRIGSGVDAASDFPDGKRGDELTVEFTLLGQSFVGLNGGPHFKPNEAVSFQVFTDDQEETDRYWNAIVDGGGSESRCGWCRDRWGFSWQIVPRALIAAMSDPDRAAAKRAMDAMMTMRKIDIAAIEAARRSGSMDASRPSDPADQPRTTAERKSDREFVVTRTVDGPARLVFDAWARPELFQRWWAPQSFGVTLISYEAEVRTGGFYRLVMGHSSSEQPMTFFGRYVEVTPPTRIVWTNEEAGEAGAVTTVTFEDRGGTTRLVVHELYPSKQALDEALASGSTSGWSEQFEQLNHLLGTLDATGEHRA